MENGSYRRNRTWRKQYPAAKLDVNGNAIFRGTTTLTGTTIVNDNLTLNSRTNITGPVVSSNNISIGELKNSNGWNRVLGVNGDNSMIYAATNNGIKTGMYSHPDWASEGARGLIGTESNHDLSFLTNYNEKMRITKDGNVGIGVKAPAAKLDVDGNVKIKGNLDVNNLTTDWNTLRTKHGYIDFGPNNASFAHIYTDRPRFIINKPLNLYGNDLENVKGANITGNLTVGGATKLKGANVDGILNVNGEIKLKNNLKLGANNGRQWIVHNPESGNMFIAPSGSNNAENWDWSNQFVFKPDGTLQVKKLQIGNLMLEAGNWNVPNSLTVYRADLGRGWNASINADDFCSNNRCYY